jgi:hypothetical protein
MSRELFSQNINYSLEIESETNRLYINMMNLWKSDVIGIYLILDIKKARKKLSDQFCVIVDLTSFKLSKHYDSEFFFKLQNIITEQGASYIAYVIPEKDQSKFQSTLQIETSKMLKKNLITKIKEAEMWLTIMQAMNLNQSHQI